MEKRRLHVTLGTTFAIKLIESQQELDEEVQLRFLNEARAAARLQSRHVVRVFDHGMTDDGNPYIAMELLHGEPLSSRLARRQRLSIGETATITAAPPTKRHAPPGKPPTAPISGCCSPPRAIPTGEP